MLCGFDDDLARQATATSNRIRGLLTQIHPALERVIGEHLDHPAMLKQLRTARDELLTQVEALVEAHPLHQVLTSMPAVGVRTAARIITEVAGKEFQSSGHLASYAGLAPVTWRTGTTIRGDHPSKKGNRTLIALACLRCDVLFAMLRDGSFYEVPNMKTSQPPAATRWRQATTGNFVLPKNRPQNFLKKNG